MITLALAKGRTSDAAMPLWQSAGLPTPIDLDDSRALVFEEASPQLGKVRFLLAKPSDVPTYVSYGVADIGIVGKDVLIEQPKDVYELLDLGVAKCKLCVAGRPEDEATRPRRVATKYPNLADEYFRGQGASVELVGLNGSIELAAVIGLADRIFDLVQTGTTLAANGLVVFDEVADVSARLIANRSSYRMKRTGIDQIALALQSVVATGVERS